VINGGAFYNNGNFYLGETANQGVGTLYLNGGLLQALQLSNQGGKQSTAYFNGGTLLAYTNHVNFIASVVQSIVQAGGMVLDDGGYTITNTTPLQADLASPGGGLIKQGSGKVYLNSTNTYTGATIVNAGTLAGSGVILGPVTVANGGALAPGNSIGTMLINNNLTFASGSTCAMEVNLDTAVNDRVVGLSKVTYGGTLAINNLGLTPFTNGAAFKLFSAASYAGNFASIVPAIPGPNLAWDTSSLTVDGTLKVGIGAPPQPPLTSQYDGTSLKLTWPPSYLGWKLQGQTNSLNVGVSSNWVTIPGSESTTSATIPVDPTQPTVFYRLVSP
jgi:autotransporter-associated beta strand protein